MSYIRQYMQNARNFANENYLNADGFIDDDTSYFTGNEDFFNADGMPMASMPQASVPTSQPYIITVSNASATTVSNFDVLGAYQYLQNTGFNASGNLVLSGITISSGISNVTYQQFLYQSMNSPFSVGLTYVQSIAGSQAQITQPMTLNTQDANGNQALKAIIVTIDPYQQQTGVVAVKQLYRIDGYTKITIASVLPSVVFQLQFYPADNINLARGLSGRPASRQYGNPKIVKDSVAVIGGDVVKARLG
tara:strand:+ start:4515 stop:5261 length:747 start_codon:yes stop_codon:yes gene_type:complete